MHPPRRLIVEGWRFLPHSYSLVNQFQLLEMMDRPGLRVAHRDVPYYRPRWRAMRGLLPAEAEQRLQEIASAAAGEGADATYRIAFPYNFAPPPPGGGRLFVFGTAEFGSVTDNMLAGAGTLAELVKQADASIITPSNWSAQGFVRGGVDAAKVHVVPHGVDVNLYSPPGEETRRESRIRLGWEGFVFLHMGMMAANKRVGMLLKAFAEVARRHPEARLVLKGLDALYSSEQMLNAAAQELTEVERGLVGPRVKYFGGTFTCLQMSEFYGASDAYVSPYFAEGFNLPVLEATACGTPVICTAGGPTDDFVSDEFAMRIESKLVEFQSEGAARFGLDASLQHLIHCMNRAIEDAEFSRRARTAGPARVRERFTWKHVVDRLLEVIFDDEKAGRS